MVDSRVGPGVRTSRSPSCQSRGGRRLVEEDFLALGWATSGLSWTTPFSGKVVVALNYYVSNLQPNPPKTVESRRLLKWRWIELGEYAFFADHKRVWGIFALPFASERRNF